MTNLKDVLVLQVYDGENHLPPFIEFNKKIGVVYGDWLTLLTDDLNIYYNLINYYKLVGYTHQDGQTTSVLGEIRSLSKSKSISWIE